MNTLTNKQMQSCFRPLVSYMLRGLADGHTNGDGELENFLTPEEVIDILFDMTVDREDEIPPKKYRTGVEQVQYVSRGGKQPTQEDFLLRLPPVRKLASVLGMIAPPSEVLDEAVRLGVLKSWWVGDADVTLHANAEQHVANVVFQIHEENFREAYANASWSTADLLRDGEIIPACTLDQKFFTGDRGTLLVNVKTQTIADYLTHPEKFEACVSHRGFQPTAEEIAKRASRKVTRARETPAVYRNRARVKARKIVNARPIEHLTKLLGVDATDAFSMDMVIDGQYYLTKKWTPTNEVGTKAKLAEYIDELDTMMARITRASRAAQTLQEKYSSCADHKEFLDLMAQPIMDDVEDRIGECMVSEDEEIAALAELIAKGAE